MADLTTKGIIKILPLDKNFQSKLLEKFDSLSADQKFQIERIVWDAYDAFYEMKLEENLQLALLKVRKGQEKLDSQLYEKVREQTEKEMEGEFYQKTEHQDLASVREKLEKLSQQN